MKLADLIPLVEEVKKIEALKKSVKQLIEKIEWFELRPGIVICPCCQQTREKGHAITCELDRLKC